MAAVGMVLVLALLGCSTDSDEAADATDDASQAPTSSGLVLFSPQGNQLDAYDLVAPFASQVVVPSAADGGLDINGQVCFLDGADPQRFVAGEDTDQDAGEIAGWGIFELDGEPGQFSASQVGKLVATFQEQDESEAEPFGCGVLSDGRVLTTDVGAQAFGEPTGQLILWFPPFDGDDVAYCKLDVGLATAQQIWVADDDVVYVSSARWSDAAAVWRFTGPFPTGPDADGGCGRVDPTGSPLADEDRLGKEKFLGADDNGLFTPSGVVGGPAGTIFVASVFNGFINQYSLADGAYLRTLVSPPAGEEITADAGYSSGNPMALVYDADEEMLYYADIGLRLRPSGLPGPGNATGAVLRVSVAGDGPQTPESVAGGLSFPDGLGLLATTTPWR